MPALGAGMDVGRILEWYVGPGDEVTRGSLIALVETDKANIDVEVFEDGVVETLLVEEGTKVPVGTPLARITARTAPSVSAPVPALAAAAGSTDASLPSHPEVATPAETRPRPQVNSPLVRRQAKAAGVDLTRVSGTGPAGTITRHDVAAAAEALGSSAAAPTPASPPASPAPPAPPASPPSPAILRRVPRLRGIASSPYARRLAAERGLDPTSLTGTGPRDALVARDVPTDRETRPAPEMPTPPVSRPAPTAGPEDRALTMRQAIARAMERSNREIPHYYLGETVDLELTLRWLTELNADRPPDARILPAALVLKATALALEQHREFNGYWLEGAFTPGEGIHLGVAINLRRGGLLAPAIRDVDQRSLDQVMEALRDLVQRTRSDGLRGSELTDPTLTVSNLGDTGVQTIQGVITPPQVALVGVGRITERPWAVDGMLAVRRTIDLGLAGDHRASDGHRGARFLGAIAANLGRPETL
jgi:pyruvate dehydrogenase E2 component (dihydrolipoamide acetyltransferase)